MLDKNSMTFLDGAMGTMLQSAGLAAGDTPEDWNITRPETILAVHRAYFEAGAEIVCCNTFGANGLKYHGRFSVEETVASAVRIAREAACGDASKKIALDIGPTGKLLKPAGGLSFETAYDAFARQVRAGAPGADLAVVETMSDTMELKAAVLAVRENSDLPVIATVALGEDGKLLTGADVECVAVLLESLGVDAYGFNCGLGPDRMLEYVRRLAEISTKPIVVKPNAGMPAVVDGRTVFSVAPEEFSRHVGELADAGARIVGGCCGTTPQHIAAVAGRLKSSPPAVAVPRSEKKRTFVSSGSAALELKPGEGLVIGERINPTGKKRLKEAYISGDVAYVLREAVGQAEAGAKILDVNCGIPGIDESSVLDSTVGAVQSVVSLPIQIDTADPVALERALRHVNGKALVNSVNGKRESMDAVFPLVRKYGGTIVALCLDENGIPETSDGRMEIARRILAEGAKYGFAAEDFVFDALTLAVSADPSAAAVTLETVRRLTEELKVNTVLGVSNVSFGLPGRVALNNAMYTLACKAGLSAAIANPLSIGRCENQDAFDVLLGRDENCARWIESCRRQEPSGHGRAETLPPPAGFANLIHSIRSGLKSDALGEAAGMLKAGFPPMKVVQEGIVPALEEVGRGFESGKVFLPQLLMAADAAGAAFESVKSSLGSQAGAARKGRPIVLATVKGDIHDIGKNIVRALLENYGFQVIDLGRDVAPEAVLEAAAKSDAMMVGLSALMTTTVGAMAETVSLIKGAGLGCATCVGGAVVTEDYARLIGADFYAADAMRTVRIAESLI